MFLSYTTREPEVRQLKAILDPFVQQLPEYTWNRLGVWYDAVDIRHSTPGVRGREDGHNSDQSLEREIRDGLSQCHFTLAMLSPHYMRSRWCEFEWRESIRIHELPAVLPACWKHAEYMRDYATWTDPYRVLWLELHQMPPLEAAQRLLEEVVAFARQHGRR